MGTLMDSTTKIDKYFMWK